MKNRRNALIKSEILVQSKENSFYVDQYGLGMIEGIQFLKHKCGRLVDQRKTIENVMAIVCARGRDSPNTKNAS